MGKPNERSASFLDQSYTDRKFVELRAGMITVTEARFRTVQSNQEKIIKPLERDDDKPRKQEIVSEAYTWKIEIRRRMDRMVRNYPKLYSNFSSVLTQIYWKMHGVYDFVSEQTTKDYKYATGAEKVSYLEVISKGEKLRSLFEPILSSLEEDSHKEMERRRMAQEAEQGKTRREITQPLIETRGDKTNSGCATYTMVKSRMEKHGVRLDNYESEPREWTGIRRKVSSDKLIGNTPTLKRESAKTVGELLMEHQSVITKTQIQQVNVRWQLNVDS